MHERERTWERPDSFCGAGLWGPQAVDRIYENAEALAFHVSREPHEAVHALVIPKRHVETLLDLEPQHGPLVMAMLEAVQSTARTLGLDESGFSVRINCLPPYQHVGHLHWHVIAELPHREVDSG
jgi:histidine triad (HIT) family protein